MREKANKIKYSDVLVLTTGNRFHRGEATMHPDSTVELSLFFDNAHTGYEVGNVLPVLDILVNLSSRQD